MLGVAEVFVASEAGRDDADIVLWMVVERKKGVVVAGRRRSCSVCWSYRGPGLQGRGPWQGVWLQPSKHLKCCKMLN